MRPFIPKENPDLPDFYKVTISYVSGKTEELEVVSHNLMKESGLIEFCQKDDLWSLVPISSVLRIAFCKDFSKIVALKEKDSKKTH